jgi:hypothetical protein
VPTLPPLSSQIIWKNTTGANLWVSWFAFSANGAASYGTTDIQVWQQGKSTLIENKTNQPLAGFAAWTNNVGTPHPDASSSQVTVDLSVAQPHIHVITTGAWWWTGSATVSNIDFTTAHIKPDTQFVVVFRKQGTGAAAGTARIRQWDWVQPVGL